MTPSSELSRDGSRLTVRLPMTIRKRGGRKVVVAPSGASMHPPRPRVDSSLVKAIARAYRWQKLLEEGTYASMRDLASAERISPSYVSRLLRLTLLSPGNVEAALDAVAIKRDDSFGADIGLSGSGERQAVSCLSGSHAIIDAWSTPLNA